MDKFNTYHQSNSYNVPEGYFEENKDKLLALAKLTALGPSEGYTVPDNYFQKSKHSLQHQISASTQPGIVQQLLPYIGAIAAVSIGVWFFTMTTSTGESDSWDQIPEEAFIAYLSQEDDVSQILIDAVSFTEGDLEALEVYDEENVEEYLEYNLEDIDIYELDDYLNI